MVYDRKITEKSFNEMLRFLRFANGIKEIPLLFGGWAVYHYNPYAGSKDVDFVVSDKNFDRCVDFLVSEGFELKELRLKKEDIFFDLYKESEGITTLQIQMDFGILFRDAERLFLRKTSFEVLVPALTDLFLFKAAALVGRNVPKDQSDVIALLLKFQDEDFQVKSELSAEIRQKLELLLNKADVFSLVAKPTKKNIDEINSRLKRLIKQPKPG